MGRSNRNRRHCAAKSHTLPSSPTHSSSSSDFEFTISISPRKSSAALCPADELFYKGQLLPLHLSPRLSLVRSLLLSSASTSTATSRDSTASSDSLYSDSARPSSATADEGPKPLPVFTTANDDGVVPRKPSKYNFFLPKFSSVFRKAAPPPPPKRASSTAKEVIRKYLKKVKPLYDKLSHKQPPQQKTAAEAPQPPRSANATLRVTKAADPMTSSHSFSGNLRCPKKRSCISSCPSSMVSSPGRGGEGGSGSGRAGCSSEASSMEELQSAIQGAIAHCKNSMMKSKNVNMVSDEF